MQYYRELTLLDDGEISAAFLWQKIYGQIHIGLANLLKGQQTQPIGVGFPSWAADKDRGIGNNIRLFADKEADFENLDLEKLLKRYLDDYVAVSRIRAVPTGRIKGQYSFSRYHQQNSLMQKVRRYARRTGKSIEDALVEYNKKYPDTSREEKLLPYIQLKSATNKHLFRLYIAREEKSQPINKGFNAYGLSGESTVPGF